MNKKVTWILTMVVMIVFLTIPAYASCDVCIESENTLFEANPNHCTSHCAGDHYETCGSCSDRYVFELCDATHQYTFTNTNGTHTGTCACGKSFSGECEFELISTTASTCSKEGYESWLCKVCDVPKTVILPVGDHTYRDEPTSITRANCNSPVISEYMCESCDHIKVVSSGEPLGHAWEEATVPPTCEIEGFLYKVCLVCGLDESEDIPALGHTFPNQWTSCTSTCYFSGRATYICTTCGGEEIRDAGMIPHEYVNGKCTMCLQAEGAATPPPSGVGGGSSSGSDGGLDLPDIDIGFEVTPMRLLGILSLIASLTGLVWYANKEE